MMLSKSQQTFQISISDSLIKKFRDLLKKRLKESGLTQAEFAKKLGITPAYLSMILKGKRQAVKNIFELALKANIDFDLFLDRPPKRVYGPVPVISWVQAGNFKEAILNLPEEAEVVYSIRQVSPHAFALKVEGDSMSPRFFAW